MKLHSLASLIIAGFSTASLSATNYISNFTGLAPGAVFDGVDGWTQNTANTYTDSPQSFGATIGSSPAAGVGGFYDTEPVAANGQLYVSHALASTLSYPLNLNMNLAIVDSAGFTVDGDPTVYGTERNPFKISFNNTLNQELFAFVFDPVAGETSSTDSWSVSWSTGGTKSSLFMGVVEAQLYQLSLNLTPNGAGVNYQVSLSSSNILERSGTVTGLSSSQTVTQMQVGISAVDSTVTGTPQLGTNHIVFNDISIVPEPSSILLLAASTCGLAARRRRVAAN